MNDVLLLIYICMLMYVYYTNLFCVLQLTIVVYVSCIVLD